MAEIEIVIQQFVAQNLLFSENGFPYGNEASFLQEGIIDSLGVMELVTFTGTAFGVAEDPQEITPENFDSVSRLAAYIRRKTGVPSDATSQLESDSGSHARSGLPTA